MPSGNGAWTVTTDQGSFDPNYANPLGLGDDELSYGHALGFDFPLRDGRTTNAIDTDSNGSILLISDPDNDSDCDFSARPFGGTAERILAYDRDLHPGTGGEIYFHTAPDLVENDITDPQRPPIYLGVGAPPVVGTTIQVTTYDLPPTTTLASLGLGFLAYEPGTDLSVIGMIGCYELTRADILLPATVNGTMATSQIPVPNDPALIALRTYLQANAVVPGANPLNLVLSDGYRLTIGR